jgi:hypothetical protein
MEGKGLQTMRYWFLQSHGKTFAKMELEFHNVRRFIFKSHTVANIEPLIFSPEEQAFESEFTEVMRSLIGQVIKARQPLEDLKLVGTLAFNQQREEIIMFHVVKRQKTMVEPMVDEKK